MDRRAQQALIAKTGEQREAYLPLRIHLQDTEAVITRLVRQWLSEAGRACIAGSMTEEMLVRLACFLALIHDLGKATPCFQRKVAPLVEDGMERLTACGLRWGALPNACESPHALAGEMLLLEAGCPTSVASIVGAHHGKPSSERMHEEPGQMELHPENYFGKSREAWESVRQALIDEALAAAGFADMSELPEVSVPVQILLSGLLIMADWLASNPAFFPLIRVDDPVFAGTAERGEQGWRRIRLPACWQPETLFATDDLCQRRFFDERGNGYTPNAVQRAMMQAAEQSAHPGVMILEAQMGVGKTEAALLAAEILSCGMDGQEKRGGIFFGLPTQATANGIFPRVCRWAQTLTETFQATLRLAHGGAALNPDYLAIQERSRVEEDAQDDSGLVVHAWFQGRKQALLSSFVIGTVDQLLMAALRQKHVMLRHLGLCGKVVIIDEIHAYDAYMVQYLDAALTWLGAYRVPVILLSATLPPQRRQELVAAYLGGQAPEGAWRQSLAYPQLTWTDGAQVHQTAIDDSSGARQVRVQRAAFDALDMDALAVHLSERLSQGGCAGVIVNTVHRAQQAAQALSRSMPDTQVLLLHAQFVLPDRIAHEDELVRRIGKQSGAAQRHRLVVVGTQVIEQSLDIDVDYLVTDLCPMDLLLQRIGRLHRHPGHDAIRPPKLQTAQCLVLGASQTLEPGSCRVYGEYLLMRTRSFLPETITLPGDIPGLVRCVYDEDAVLPQTPPGYGKAREQHERQCRDKQNRASVFRLNLPEACPDFPWLNTMTGLMDGDYRGDEPHAQAAVRDGDPSIEVLLMKTCGEQATFAGGGPLIPTDHVPDRETCMEIARQRIRLPRALCVPWQRADQTIEELKRRSAVLDEWQQSPWLQGELVLLLDQDNATTLNGYCLTYDRETGLHCTKEDHDV